MKDPEKEKTVSPSKIKEKKKLSSASGTRRVKKKKIESSASEKPNFTARKRLFKKRSFRKQYDMFRGGGLGKIDSFFNALYIELTEKSI
ncbi:MAG: hypothetical protein IKU24_04540, partial [Clostridia bacterium]|nr:hypothetical protein [Clostridia bacterium]